jgi:hypothetical protein
MAARKKGREKRAGTSDEGTGLVRVKLTPEQVSQRSDELASYIKKLEDVEGKKSAAAEKYNGEIKLLKEKISVLADEVDTREANVDAQQAMDFDGYAGKRKRGSGPADEPPANDEAPTPVEGAA